jgi:hypothetical protein
MPADEVIEQSFCDASIGGREASVWVKNCRAILWEARPLCPRKLPRQASAIAAVKGQFRPRASAANWIWYWPSPVAAMALSNALR